MSFRVQSERDFQGKREGSRKYLRKPYKMGLEIEQAGATSGVRVESILINSENPTRLPTLIPNTVRARSSVPEFHGHWDGSKPWEFNTPATSQESQLLQYFNTVVDGDWWVWHSEFNYGHERRGCGSHIHISPRGNVVLADQFGNQKTSNANEWAILHNNMVTYIALTPIFWAFGRNFRKSALSRWAKPVIGRVSHKHIVELFDPTKKKTYSGNGDEWFSLGHSYTALSYNTKGKREVTLENRLNENHPYWTIPAMSLFNIFNNACVQRRKSIKLMNSPTRLKECWNLVRRMDIYRAMAHMQDLQFVEGRGLPYLCGGAGKTSGTDKGGTDKVYPTALDLFRQMCRRFYKSKLKSSINYGKVMRLYSDCIDLSKIPAHLVWDIDELYRRVYEDENKQRYQDAYLYFGSEIVIPDKGRYRKVNWDALL